MRALLTLTVGGPVRVATTALAIVVIAAVASGSGWDLLRAAWMMSLAASGFTLLYAVLALVAAATGACDETPAPASEEADRG
ncbi:hypothetical protein SAMN05216360_104213 [Methylobacterium phyllostachyos]|uniref:Uncharacterized protein n=1 Tax=Methylobacterium phyllostachyos TaxID=582672 RepID=A0A1G9X1U9_9HYPH|nr:hypothetical protein [Methylobacterium phyllostachyos]SDM90652.1 hypothetical protein SAMN05216360_104213 [Methylobacterium phyllostachyos]